MNGCCTGPHFDREAKDNSDMTILNLSVQNKYLCHYKLVFSLEKYHKHLQSIAFGFKCPHFGIPNWCFDACQTTETKTVQ